MQRVEIFVAENMIFIDGRGMALDCRPLRSEGLKFVRWYGKHGETEYVGGSKPNRPLVNFDAYKWCVDRARGL